MSRFIRSLTWVCFVFFTSPVMGETWYLALSAALPALGSLPTVHPSSSRCHHSLLSSLWVIYSIDCVSPAFVMHSSVPGHFGCSHAVVLTCEAVARMVLFRYLPRRCGITGCVGSRVFCFEGTSLLFSGVAVSSLCCHPECRRVPFSACPVYYWLCQSLWCLVSANPCFRSFLFAFLSSLPVIFFKHMRTV